MDKNIEKTLDELTNNMGLFNREDFLRAMRRLHPTLQQRFAGLIFAWLNEYPTFAWDERNEASIKECRRIINAYDCYTGESKIKDVFPMV